MVDRCECRFAKTVWSPNSSDSGGSTGLKFNKTDGSSSIGALLINFREEATTCCLIIASHAAATEPLSLSLFFLSRLVCTPRKSMTSPAVLASIPGLKSFATAFIHFTLLVSRFAARKSTDSCLHSGRNRYRSMVAAIQFKYSTMSIHIPLRHFVRRL